MLKTYPKYVKITNIIYILFIIYYLYIFFKCFTLFFDGRVNHLGAIGIIAEFNPLHNGHKNLINTAKETGKTVVCALSGNFVQRGDVALLSKQKRTEAALKAGADIVCEMPVLWSMSTAANFAVCGVWNLYNLGCDEIIFGSECGDINKLDKISDILLSDEFSLTVANEIKTGVTFAAAREKAAVLLGAEENILSGPNDNLGVEYIIAAKKLNLPIKFTAVKRAGAPHDSSYVSANLVSSSFLREKILSGDTAYAERFMPSFLRGSITDKNSADIKNIERTVLGILRTKSAEDFKNLPDMGEGLDNKLYFSLKVATSLEELYNMIKSKRYTLSRVRRLVLSAALGFDNSFFMKTPPYVRVLGFSESGLKTLRNTVSLCPVVTKVSDIKALGEDALKVLETESRATDIYALSFKEPLPCGLEYTTKLLKRSEYDD